MRLNENKLRRLIRKETLTYQQRQLNEGIMDFLGSVLGAGATGMIDRAKDAAATWLLNRLGIQTNGLLGRTLVNVFENLEMTELWSIITGDQARCPAIAREVIEAFAETLLEQLPETFGIDADGWFSGTIREVITNYLVRDSRLTARISQAICNMDVSDMFQSAGAPSGTADRLEQALNLNESLTRRARRAPTSQAKQLIEARERYRQIILAERRIRRRR